MVLKISLVLFEIRNKHYFAAANKLKPTNTSALAAYLSFWSMYGFTKNVNEHYISRLTINSKHHIFFLIDCCSFCNIFLPMENVLSLNALNVAKISISYELNLDGDNESFLKQR